MAALKNIGPKLREKRGERGIREVAKEIGISPATLSRIENGHVPDLETFSKLCGWLELDPSELIGGTRKSATTKQVAVHFKKESTLKPETAQALSELILLAQRSMELKKG